MRNDDSSQRGCPHLQMAPNDPDLRRKLAEAEKEVKRIRFEEALSLPVCAVFASEVI